MNKQRKTSNILNVFQYDETTGAVTLPSTLVLTAPANTDNSTKVPTTAWTRSYVSGLNYLTGNQTITVSGDASGSGTTSINLTLANTAVTPGTYGSTTLVPVVTVDSKGRITNVTTAAISGALTFTGDVTGTGTTGTSTALTLANSGVTAGTYTKVTVDLKGRVTVGASATTSDIAEGTNLYYTSARFDTAFAGKSTTNLAEGTNLYYTDARVLAYLGANNYATQSYVGTQIANLVASAPAALDTLNELAAALGNDASFATTTATSLGNRLRVDIGTQGLTSTQQGYGRTNLGLGTAATSAIGDFATAAQGTKADSAYGWGNHASAGYLTSATAATTYASLSGSYANPAWITSLAYSKITGVPAFLTSYTETDTLSSVTGRGASTSTAVTFSGGATISNLLLNGASAYTEGSLALGAMGTSEGGQLVLNKATSYTYAGHIDMWQDVMRFLYGTNTATSGVAMSLNLSTRQLILPQYTTSTTFTGTAAGVLAFDSSGNIITIAVPGGAVSSVSGGTGVSVNSTTGAVTVSIGQSVATSATPSFDQVFTTNNGNGTNVKIGDDVWIGDVNAANTLGIKGQQDATAGYITFGSELSNKLGRTGTGALTWGGNTIYHAGNLTNLNQLTNGPGYITGITSSNVTTALGYTPYNSTNPNGYISSYTETSTLANVTARGATTSTETTYYGGLRTRKSQTAGNYTTAALWTESYDNTATGIAFHISGVKGTFLEMRTNQVLYWDGNTVYHSGNLTNLNQLSNGPGYITSYSETDTLATVTARGASTTAGITVNGRMTAAGGGTYAVTGSSSQRYIIQALNTSNSVNASYGWWWFHNANGDMGFHADAVGDILTLTRGGGASINGNTILTAGNYTSYSPSLTGSGASGTWGINITGGAGSANLASQVTINYNNDSNSTYQLLWGSGNSVYGTSGVYVNPYTDYVTATSFQASDWFRSSGTTGWYNSSYAVGIYAIDSTWVRTYNNAQFYSSTIIQAGGSVRAPIFYDADDTGYYLDPNSTSNLYRTNILNNYVGNAIYFGGGNNYLNWNGNIHTNVSFSADGNIYSGGYINAGSVSSNTTYDANFFGRFTPDGKYLTRNWQLNDGGYTWPSLNYTQISDSPIGSYTMRGNSGSYTGQRQMGWVAIDKTKTYKVSVWVRSLTGNPYVYLSFTQAGWDLSQPDNGGWGQPYFWNGVPSTSWTEYTMTIGPSGSGAQYTWYSYARYAQLGVLMNYPNAGYTGNAEYTGFKMEEVDSTLANGTTVLGTFYANGSAYANSNRLVENTGTWSISVTGSAGSVDWGNVGGKPAGWLSTTNLIQDYAPSDGAVPSGFYQNYAGNGNPTGTWFNYINVRHSNPGNGHGYQIGMSYYDSNLWFRSYQGGTSPSFASWAYAISSLNIGSQSVSYSNNSGALSGYGYTNFLGKNGNSYYQTSDWIQLNGAFGLYCPSVNGAHWYPNADNTYGTWRLLGFRNSYTGITMGSAAGTPAIMYDGSGNGGLYHQGYGDWHYYFHWGNRCMGINGSSTSSSYGLYINSKGIYADGDIVAYSDVRKKDNIVTIDNALFKVLNLRGVYYTRIDQQERGRQTGVIAQEINQVLPEVVTYAADVDEYGVSYGNITGVLIEAIKEQQKQIEELQNKLDNVLSSR